MRLASRSLILSARQSCFAATRKEIDTTLRSMKANSMQRTGASRSVRAVIVAQWRLAPSADAGRPLATSP